jgi:hypothetical protein
MFSPYARQTVPNPLHLLVQPFLVAGLSVDDILSGAAQLLKSRGETQALQLVQAAQEDIQEVEIRALLG